MPFIPESEYLKQTNTQQSGFIPESTGTIPILPKQQETQSKFSLGKMMGNIIPSAGGFVKSIGTAIAHPIETAKSIGKIGLGAAEKLIPGEQAHEQSFNQVKDYFVDRYGGIDNLLKSLESDPVGVAVDVSVLFGGAGAGLKGISGAGKVSAIGKAGKVASTIGRAIDPITATTKAIKTIGIVPKKIMGTLGAESLGVTTGAGGEIIRTAFRSGKTASKEFTEALRGITTKDNVLTASRDALQTLKNTRSTTYQNQLNEISKIKQVINATPLRAKIDGLLKDFNITRNKKGILDFSKSKIADTSEAKRIQAVVDETLKWKNNTPAGLDILKQRLDDFFTPSGQGRALTGSIRSEVKSLLSKNVKGYDAMVKGYEETSKLIKEIESSLSLKAGTSADTTIRKLASALKRDADFRKELLVKIDDLNKSDIAGQIAGAVLNPFVPSGLIGRSIFASGPISALFTGFSSVSPTLFSGLAFSSPRVVGEFIRALGLGSRYAENISKAVSKIYEAGGRTTTKSLFQLGRLKLKEQQ